MMALSKNLSTSWSLIGLEVARAFVDEPVDVDDLIRQCVEVRVPHVEGNQDLMDKIGNVRNG